MKNLVSFGLMIITVALVAVAAWLLTRDTRAVIGGASVALIYLAVSHFVRKKKIG